VDRGFEMTGYDTQRIKARRVPLSESFLLGMCIPYAVLPHTHTEALHESTVQIFNKQWISTKFSAVWSTLKVATQI
jgi:hypothetical protein